MDGAGEGKSGVPLREMWGTGREPGLWCFGAETGGGGQQESTRTCRALSCLGDILGSIGFLENDMLSQDSSSHCLVLTHLSYSLI